MNESNNHGVADEDLPGGAIGPGDPNGDKTRTWTRSDPDAAPHQPDDKLERTAVRWADGWYVVTADPETAEATWRRGPFAECAQAESTLLKLADSANAPPAGAEPTERAEAPKDGASLTGTADEPDEFETPHDLPNSVYDRAEQLCNEGHAKRLYDACTRWQLLAEQARAGRAATSGEPEHCEDAALGASGDASPADVREVRELVLKAAREYDQWLEG